MTLSSVNPFMKKFVGLWVLNYPFINWIKLQKPAFACAVATTVDPSSPTVCASAVIAATCAAVDDACPPIDDRQAKYELHHSTNIA